VPPSIQDTGIDNAANIISVTITVAIAAAIAVVIACVETGVVEEI
jgi:hypothetical protein